MKTTTARAEEVNIQRVVVVGNGMVGQKFVDTFVAAGGLAHSQLVVIGEESRPAYDRVALSTWFDGATLDDLNLCDEASLRRQGVEFRFGTTVQSIDRAAKTVALSNESELSYDRLVLATGSSAFVPPIPGAQGPGRFVYRTLDDLDAMKAFAAGRTRGVVVGGGLLGLEAANALKNLGLETTVVEMADRLMPQQLDDPASEVLGQWISDKGIEIELEFQTGSIESSEQTAGALTVRTPIEDRDDIETDLVVFSAGIRPRDEVAAAAGLERGLRGGLVVDDTLATSDPSIFAIGEVACFAGMVYGLVSPGYEMARVLADRFVGEDRRFESADLSTKLKLLGVDVACFGTPGAGDDRVEYTDPTRGIHRRVSLANGVVTGGVLIGDVSNYAVLHAMSTGAMASVDVGSHVLPERSGTSAAVDLPETAQICSCNDVSRCEVAAAVRSGATTLGEVKTSTGAGTGCGGCVPDVNVLTRNVLVEMGVDHSDGICEHFTQTRQELFDLVRVRQLATWNDVLDTLGSGRGCEVCRPVVGSILASLSNGYILGDGQSNVQDTNDHSLANMQRNGTYSVVPRIPGGEITPAQLITIGQIAEDYDLYTKITGAQRIDLFGAQLHELPEIWGRVIDAGLESGHAYGKALRTVKSCVGSTWCRYGVQDSVAMAIELELRYRGLRAPHKLKSAVSGCTRECAEAQSKDFGIIATEAGWNLYVGGNGGRVPRHGDLFGVDLTSEELIRTIDRYLMFYIFTADKLQRTSTWLEMLEGGVDYLREVIVEDSLGVCAELDAAMEKHVDGYECEWTATIGDPERMKHFVEFVNAPDEHSKPVWITERDQRVPARP